MVYPNCFQPNTFAPFEHQTLLGMYDDLNRARWFCDLRHLTDDITVLKNPHKGWFWHYVDNGIRRPAYRDDIADDDYLIDFPGLPNGWAWKFLAWSYRNMNHPKRERFHGSETKFAVCSVGADMRNT